jgi:methanethiol oxidase
LQHSRQHDGPAARAAGTVVTRIVAKLALSLALAATLAVADETCMSPYLPKVIGQEDFVYVWTGGIEGVGDGSDKLVTIGANPARDDYGKVVSWVSVGGRHEAHDGDFTDDRRYFWAGGLDDAKVFVFDVAADPKRPKLVRTIDSFTEQSAGVLAPNAFFALPGRMLLAGLASEGPAGRAALVQYSNAGRYIETVWFPARTRYGYDARALPRLNLLLTSSFGDPRVLRRSSLVATFARPEALGSTMVLWDLHARKPRQVLDVPGAPLSVRWALQPGHDYAFTITATTSRIWLVERGAQGVFKAQSVATVGDPAKRPVPVDLSLSLDDRLLFVVTAADGFCHVFDVTDPHHPKLLAQEKIGAHLGRVSQTWYGGRLYFSSSFLSAWDQGDRSQFVGAYRWDGARLSPLFTIDFIAAGLGRPHAMRFGTEAFYRNEIEVRPAATRGEPVVAP